VLLETEVSELTGAKLLERCPDEPSTHCNSTVETGQGQLLQQLVEVGDQPIADAMAMLARQAMQERDEQACQATVKTGPAGPKADVA